MKDSGSLRLALREIANQVVEICGSTNDLARTLGDAGYPHGTWVSARRQEAGRGRLGRVWQSLDGNLFLSVLFRAEDKARWTWVPLVTAVGIARALKKTQPKLDVRIKWPNDLWLIQEHGQGDQGGQGGQGGRVNYGAKLGGILCEAVGTQRGSYIVVGIGLNCVVAPEGLDQQTVALGGGQFSADKIRPVILRELKTVYEALIQEGPQWVRAEFESWAALPQGTLIEWSQGQSGTVQGLGESGELKVLSSGVEMRLYADDVKIKVAR